MAVSSAGGSTGQPQPPVDQPPPVQPDYLSQAETLGVTAFEQAPALISEGRQTETDFTSLIAANQTLTGRLEAAESVLADVVGFLVHLFPGHPMLPTTAAPPDPLKA